jgi:DNA-binding IclR family transcriptional regulator
MTDTPGLENGRRRGVADTLNSVHNAAHLLGLFTPEDGEWGLTAIARGLDLTKQSTLRLLRTLEAEGLVERVPGQTKYRLGIRLWELGCNVIQRGSLHERSRPILEDLASASRLSVHLATYSHGEVVYLDKIDSPEPVQAYTRIGMRAPTHAVATGKALLAYQPEAEVERLILAGLERFTATTITSPELLRAELAAIRRDGIAFNRGEWRDLVWGLAAPVFHPTPEMPLAVGISGLALQFETPGLAELSEQVRGAGHQLSRALGGSLDHRHGADVRSGPVGAR